MIISCIKLSGLLSVVELNTFGTGTFHQQFNFEFMTMELQSNRNMENNLNKN